MSKIDQKEYLNMHGVRITLEGDLEKAREHIHEVKRLKEQLDLENVNSLSDVTKRVDNAETAATVTIRKVGIYYISRVYYPPVSRVEVEEVSEEEMKIRGVPSYVLLVEMHDVSTASYGLPNGFAVFQTAAGEGEVGELKFIGYTSGVLEESKDPPGLIGQATKRTGWCYDKMFKAVGIEQVKRVDQGWGAYDGDERIYEVTELDYNNSIWSYEGIEWPVYWEYPDPGPPPEAVCGYTWDIDAAYGGPGIEDYHDIRHLFYMRKDASGDLTYWYPVEFNQLLKITQQWNQEACLYRRPDAYADEWDYVGGDLGLESTISSICFPGSITSARVVLDATRRAFGIVWGTTYSPINHYTARVSDTFPYVTLEQYTYREKNITTPTMKEYLSYTGVFVHESEDSLPEHYINGALSWDKGQTWERTDFYSSGTRLPVSTDKFSTAGTSQALTDNELVLINGFAGGDADTLVSDLAKLVVIAGGTEYVIDANFNSDYSAYFNDLGIFTKKGKGIKDDEVDPSTVDPIYTYNVIANGKIRYGMILGEKNYITEEFNNYAAVCPDTLLGTATKLTRVALMGSYDAKIIQ